MEDGVGKYGLVQSRLGAHWYDRENGTPQHHHDLRGARKYGHYPSVTTYLRCWPKPALERWKGEQLVLAALTLPRKEGESIDEFAKRAVEDSEQEVRKAADIGTVIHEAMAWRLIHGDWPPNEALKPFFECWEEWMRAEIEEVFVSEESFVHKEFGYGGTIDLVARTRTYGVGVLDFKNKNVKENKPFWADEFLFQLVAYEEMTVQLDYVPQIDNLVSIIIDRNTPKLPYVYAWPKDQWDWGWECFRACQRMWHLHKGYDPIVWEPPIRKTRARKTSKVTA